jgi:hypothetical protein
LHAASIWLKMEEVAEIVAATQEAAEMRTVAP